MNVRDPLRGYHAYLLRCWQEQDVHTDGPLAWRFSIEEPHSGARRSLTNWEALLAFLLAELQDESLGDAGAPRDQDREG